MLKHAPNKIQRKARQLRRRLRGLHMETHPKKTIETHILPDDGKMYRIAGTTIGSMVIGGTIGSGVAGPVGTAVGAVVGGVVGYSVSNHESQRK
ncbi:MAG: glycine zipper domain-containing protein [Pirellulales bacterium]